MASNTTVVPRQVAETLLSHLVRILLATIAAALAILATVLYVAAHFLSSRPTLTSAFTHIAHELVAGTIVAAVFAFADVWVSKLRRRIVVQAAPNLATTLATHTAELNQALNHVQNEVVTLTHIIRGSYGPQRIYPASNAYDKCFNDDLESGIRTSREYIFLGKSAKYAAWRLSRIQASSDLQARVLILDPRDGVAINAEAMDRRAQWTLQEPMDATVRQVKEDIYASVLALHRLVKPKAMNLQIAIVGGESTYRIEVVSEALYLAPLDAASLRERRFPQTYRYDSSSEAYRQLRLLAARAFYLGSQRCEISRNFETMSPEEVLERLEAPRRGEDGVEHYREAFSSFSKKLEQGA